MAASGPLYNNYQSPPPSHQPGQVPHPHHVQYPQAPGQSPVAQQSPYAHQSPQYQQYAGNQQINYQSSPGQPMNQIPQTPQAHPSQSPLGQYPIQHQVPGQQPQYQSSAHGPQLHQSPQVQHPGLPQQYAPTQQPNVQTVSYGVAAPPTAAQHQLQYQQQAAQFASQPSAPAQGQLQATAQSLFKSGKGFLGNIASNIKSKYPATTNAATTSSTVSYTGEPPKPTYNPAQHPTQTPLSPTNSFPQGYDHGQQVTPQHALQTPQQNVSPSAPGYPPVSHQGSFPQSQGLPVKSPQQGYNVPQQVPHQVPAPMNGVAGAQAANSQPSVHSPGAAASPYPQTSLHHQQSGPYAPTAPVQAPQSVAPAGPYGAQPGYGQSHSHVIPPQPNHHSPSSYGSPLPSWPQQTQANYSPAGAAPSSVSTGQAPVQVSAPGYGPMAMHPQPPHHHDNPIPHASPPSQQVVPPLSQQATTPSQAPNPPQMASPPQPPQQYQTTTSPAYHQPQLHQQVPIVQQHGQINASEMTPSSQVASYPSGQVSSSNYTQTSPSSPPSQNPHGRTPVAQVQQNGPSPQNHYQTHSQPQPQFTPYAPRPEQQVATPDQSHIPLPSSPLQNLNQPSGILPSAPEAGVQYQPYNSTVVHQAPQVHYGQPTHGTPSMPINSQYNQHLVPPPPGPGPAPALTTTVPGQSFQSHQPVQQSPHSYQPVPVVTQQASGQITENISHQDPLASLSAQMDNLNMKNGEQRMAASGTAPSPKNEGPRGPPPCLAAGMVSDTLPYCPESRIVSYALDWYRLTAVPQYLICTRCYEDHIMGTHLSMHFERYHSPEGTESKCGFWSPRAREVLWPQALQINDIGHLRAFAEKTLTLPNCKGRMRSTAADGVKWWGMVNNEVDGFISCEACYEDCIVGTAFEGRFSPHRQQGPEENWMCDLCLPYITTAAVKMSKMNNWNSFIEAVKARVHLPVCEGKDEESNNGHWILPRRRIDNMRICEACYLDKLALTRFGNEFERHQRADGFDAFLESIGQKWKCSLTDTAVNMSIALEAALYRRDYEVFWNAASAICSLVPCTTNGIIGGNWWTVAGGCRDFNVCEACYKGALETSDLGRFFEPAQRDPAATIICNFCPGSPRWGAFITKFAEALDKGIFSYYGDYVKKWAGVSTCPGIKNREKSKWWGHPEALACEDCWLNFVTETPLGDTVPVKGVYDERPLICQLWSPRMRNMWLAACAAGPPGSPQSQMALDEFRAFGTKRVQVYNATVPHIEMIQSMMMMKRMQAMQQGQLSLMYQGMNSMSSIMGTTDGHLHGNSSIGYYETENGATAANMMNNMHSGMADSNKMSDWMQIAQLQAAWMEVE